MSPSRVLFTSASQLWKTPPEVYAALDAEFGFDFDPCPTDPQFDGLSIEWGNVNFVNPPYKQLRAWCEKAVVEWRKGKTVVMLIPSRTDTRAWHECCMLADEIRFIKGRLQFLDPATGKPFIDPKTGKPTGAPFPSAIIVFKGRTT